MLTLANLSPQKGSRKQKKRVGRGPGSGHGKTSGRGHKGARARSGYQSKPGFEGGQMPLQRRLPKRGFKNIFRKDYEIVGIGQLEIFEAGQQVTTETLVTAGLVKPGRAVKILANGEITKALTITVEKMSAQAKAMVEQAGGSVVVTATTEEQD